MTRKNVHLMCEKTTIISKWDVVMERHLDNVIKLVCILNSLFQFQFSYITLFTTKRDVI